MIKKIISSPRLPFIFFHLPTVPYILWLVLKARSIFFYTACNPIVGNHQGTSKDDMLNYLDPCFRPRSTVLPADCSLEKGLQLLQRAELNFPVVAKPDQGERGRGVARLENPDMLAGYLAEAKGAILLQEFIDSPHEVGILYARYPGEDKGFITSLSIKKLPIVTGDGRSTVAELIQQDPVMRMFSSHYRKLHGNMLDRVIDDGESMLLDFVGQQIRGTRFTDGMDLITPELTDTFDRIFKKIPGFFLGRADLKIPDLEGLARGEGVKILEINCTASMPIHIFDPKYNVFETYAGMFDHWRHIYEISKRNHKLGIPYITVGDALRYLKRRFSPVTADQVNHKA